MTGLAGPAVRAVLARRVGRGKEDPARLGERLGKPGAPRPHGPLVWLHAASVGESLSILPLVERLGALDPAPAILVTTGTVTSARLMGERLPQGALHQFVPVDLPSAVDRFLDHWRPDLAIWVESELWPNLVLAAARRGVPMALVNARMSETSARNWRRLPGLATPLMHAFEIVLAQSDEDAARFAALGARGVTVPGNLKAAAGALDADPVALLALESAIGLRPRWLAASTHPGEERLVAEAHATLVGAHPDLLTIIVPRHPARGGEIAAELAGFGLSVARRANGDLPGPRTGVYLADTMGELGLFYRLSPIAFVGNSLVGAGGGHNPLEPARLCAAVLSGPKVANFTEAFATLEAAGAARIVPDGAALADAVGALLADPAEVLARGAAGARAAASDHVVLDRIMGALLPLLEASRRDAAA
jgi:3-deoxy-D-manno-octulosonic-acid transferase